jgi:hypothetical protein
VQLEEHLEAAGVVMEPRRKDPGAVGGAQLSKRGVRRVRSPWGMALACSLFRSAAIVASAEHPWAD